ncbi:general secretion pathway protein G [Nitrosovibrio sp. Nv6]|nr:general secretion pathway protein G [Nitrosovibrio sp. Nv6]
MGLLMINGEPDNADSGFIMKRKHKPNGGVANAVSPNGRRHGGFTLIELLVVMAIIAILLTIAAPKYFNSLDRSRETVLRQDLNVMRDAIDKFNSDTGQYPEDLAELVEKRYLRAIPVDPLTDSADTWVAVPPPDGGTGVYDVRSGSADQAKDETSYGAW